MSSEAPDVSEAQPLLGQRAASTGDCRRSSFSAYEARAQAPSSRHGAAPNPPLFQKLFSSQYTVSNPGSGYDIPTVNKPGVHESTPDLESGGEYDTRASILSIMRPQKLIGQFQQLASWKDSVVDAGAVRNRRLRRFYEAQNDLLQQYIDIDYFLDYGKMHLNMLSTYTDPADADEPVALPYAAEAEMARNNSKSRINDVPGNIAEGGQMLGSDDKEFGRQVYVAIMVNFGVNFVLLIGKIFIFLLTSSLSVIASLVDSILDFLSTFIIYIANRLSNTKNWRSQIAYPIGRTRLEPLGVLIFSVIIIISFLQVGLESFKKLFLDPNPDKTPVAIGFSAVAIMVSTIMAKVCCWLWCSSSKSSSVQALAQDAMTDVVFNTVSLIAPVAGHILNIWWLDPAGALGLSLYVILNWSFTAFEHIDNLTGAVADAQDYKVVLYLAYRFAESIRSITALKVYHAGDKLNVEIDVVFDTENFNLSFKDAHDIAEALQYAIETLPNIERAFVHIDYMEGNFKGHLH